MWCYVSCHVSWSCHVLSCVIWHVIWHYVSRVMSCVISCFMLCHVLCGVTCHVTCNVSCRVMWHVMCHDVSCVGSPVTKRESFKRFVLSAVFSANPHSARSELSGWALSVYSTLFYTSKNIRELVKRHTKLWLCSARAVMTSLCTWCIRPSHVCFTHRNYCGPVFNILSNVYVKPPCDLLSFLY